MVSYTAVSPLPKTKLIVLGGLLSVALFPRIAPGGSYPPLCSLESGLSSVYLYNAVIRMARGKFYSTNMIVISLDI